MTSGQLNIFDCSPYRHAYDPEDNRDRHFDPNTERWYTCDIECCPNRAVDLRSADHPDNKGLRGIEFRQIARITRGNNDSDEEQSVQGLLGETPEGSQTSSVTATVTITVPGSFPSQSATTSQQATTSKGKAVATQPPNPPPNPPSGTSLGTSASKKPKMTSAGDVTKVFAKVPQLKTDGINYPIWVKSVQDAVSTI